MKDIAIFGIGGFGREVLALIQDINRVEPQWNIVGFFDDGYEKGLMINGYPTLGKTEDLNNWETDIAIAISIGSPVVKKKILDNIYNPKVSYPTLIHPSVWIGDEEFVEIGSGKVLTGMVAKTCPNVKACVINSIESLIIH